MEHLDFVNELNKFGVSLRSTNTENREKTYIILGSFGMSNSLTRKNFQLTWDNRDGRDPLKEFIRLGIDMDSWKHSWHLDINPEKYEKFKEIIQDKILDRAAEIDTLMDIYFQLQHEISQIPPNNETDDFNL